MPAVVIQPGPLAAVAEAVAVAVAVAAGVAVGLLVGSGAGVEVATTAAASMLTLPSRDVRVWNPNALPAAAMSSSAPTTTLRRRVIRCMPRASAFGEVMWPIEDQATTSICRVFRGNSPGAQTGAFAPRL
jgi:hypothetical protein